MITPLYVSIYNTGRFHMFVIIVLFVSMLTLMSIQLLFTLAMLHKNIYYHCFYYLF